MFAFLSGTFYLRVEECNCSGKNKNFKKKRCESLFPYQPMETILHKPSASQSWCLSRRRFYSSDHFEAEIRVETG